MSTPAVKVEVQAPVAPDNAPSLASETTATIVAPTLSEQAAVPVDSKPSVPSASTAPATVAEPTVTVSNPASSATSTELPTQVTSGVAAPALKVQPATTAKAPPAAVAAPVPASTVPAAAPVSANTTAIAASKSKAKKKKGMPTVTMATAPNSSSGQGTQGENTGRWTAEEHRLFLQGLEQHGKGWKKIASLIKSRTVVQIRTHAQKYFQKLAKARQNGEEGDVAMEGRGGSTSIAAGGIPGSNGVPIKRRRQTTGTKRKAISSVVTSAQRQGKKMAVAQAAAGVPCPKPPLPAVAPALAPFVLPNAMPQQSANSASQGIISGAALEDSLFRFLTPTPVASTADPLNVQVNDVARQAGANAITVPTDVPPNSQGTTGGEVSPTGVMDVAMFMTDTKDMPTWYSKGADVDCLLDVADTLDWLTDTGDLNEAYQPPPMETKNAEMPQLSKGTEAEKTDVVQAAASVASIQDSVPPLPSLFEGTESSEPPLKKQVTSTSHLSEASEGIDEHLNVFDTPMEEHAFVSALLENNGESSGSLPALS